MKKTCVFLIGGAPGVGKTTLGSTLAGQLGITSLSVDDLMTAAQAVTTPETHPKFHVMRNIPYPDYYTRSSLEQLKADATAQHEAVWPMVKQVILKHANGDSAIVIDGWHLRPNWVVDLGLYNVQSDWIVASPSVLIKRESENTGWMKDSPDQKQMLENFLARSLWYNNLIDTQATALGMNILRQTGETTVEELCKMCLADSNR